MSLHFRWAYVGLSSDSEEVKEGHNASSASAGSPRLSSTTPASSVPLSVSSLTSSSSQALNVGDRIAETETFPDEQTDLASASLLASAPAPPAEESRVVFLPLVATVDSATTTTSLGLGFNLGLDLFGTSAEMDYRMNGSTSHDVDYDEVERLERQAQRIARREQFARRDRSRSRGNDFVPPLSWIPHGQSFGEAMRSLVAVRHPDSVPLVDLTDGVTSLQAALLVCGRRVRREPFAYYLGITECPSRRFAMHQASGSWARMVLLAKARSSRETVFLERALIKEQLDNLNLRCHNFGPGGECASAGTPHYLYLLVGHNNLLRRSH